MGTFADFIKANQEKIRHISDENSKCNKAGLKTISKDDPWVYESEWDTLYKEMEHSN